MIRWLRLDWPAGRILHKPVHAVGQARGERSRESSVKRQAKCPTHIRTAVHNGLLIHTAAGWRVRLQRVCRYMRHGLRYRLQRPGTRAIYLPVDAMKLASRTSSSTVKSDRQRFFHAQKKRPGFRGSGRCFHDGTANQNNAFYRTTKQAHTRFFLNLSGKKHERIQSRSTCCRRAGNDFSEAFACSCGRCRRRHDGR